LRYIRQRERDHSGCGPIAIMNAKKWAGEKFAARDIEQQIKKECFHFPADINGPYVGVMPTAFDNALDRHKSFSVERIIMTPTMPEIDKCLDHGFAVILRYLHGEDGGHYVLCTGRTKKTYTVVNVSSYKNTVSTVTRKEMKKMLHHTVVFFSEVCFCVAWVIKKGRENE